MHTAAVTAVAVLGVLALLCAAIMLPYLCALLTSRVLGWMLQIGDDTSAGRIAVPLSADEVAGTNALLARSRRTREAERHCRGRAHGRPAAR